MKKIKLMALLLVSVLSINLWGEDPTLTINYNSFSSHGTSYNSKSWSAKTTTDIDIIGVGNVCFENDQTYVKLKNEKPGISNSTALPGSLKSVTATRQSEGSNRQLTLYGGKEQLTSTNIETKGTSLGQKNVTTSGVTWTLTEDQISQGYTYFYLIGSSNVAYLDNVVITYEAAAACTNSITITKGTTSNGSFTLDQEGDVCIDDGNATIVVTPTPNTHYIVDQVTSNSGSVSGPDADGKYTVSNISASTTINVTFAEKDKVTITFTDKIHDNNSNYQEYVGDAIQFPSITDTEKGSGCEGEHYHFVGWTKDSSKPTDLVTPSNEKAPSMEVEYFAVWAKEAE